MLSDTLSFDSALELDIIDLTDSYRMASLRLKFFKAGFIGTADELE